MRGGTEPGQQYRGGDPQPGRDLGRGGARLDQFQHLPGEPAPYRAGRVAPVAFDGDQLGDPVEQVEPLLGPVGRVRAHRQQPVGDGRAPGCARGCRTDGEEGVRLPVDGGPHGPAASGADRGQAVGGEPGGGLVGERLLVPGAGDAAAGGGEDPGAQVQVGAEQVEDDLGAAARGPGRHQPPVPVDDGGQVPGALARDPADDVFGDGGEGDRLVDREERQAVPGARLDQVLGDRAQLRLTGGEGAHPGGREDADEGLGVGGVAPPGQSGEDQFAAGEVAAGVAQVGGHHTADRAVQLVLAAEQPQAEAIGPKQGAQPHLVAADLSFRNRWTGVGQVSRRTPPTGPSAHRSAASVVSGAKRRGYRSPPFI